MFQRLINKYNNLPVQIRASFWFLICSFLQKGISMITTPIFTRLLSTSEYGQFSVFNSWLGICTVIVSLQLYSGVYSSGLVKFEEERNVFTSSMEGLCTTLVMIWTIIYLLFHDFWNNIFQLTTVQMLAMLVMIWTTAIFHFWSLDQRVDFKYKALVIVTLIVSLAKPILGIVLVINANDKVTARILGLVLVELVAYTGFFFSHMKKGKVFYSKQFWKYALIFNIPLIPHYLSMTVLSSSDRIMIGNMCGNSQAGIYSLAYSISQIMTMFNTALLSTLEPWIYKKIKVKKIKEISKVAYPAFIAIACLNIMLIACAPEAVSIFAPKEYYEAIYIIPPVAMSVFFIFLYTFFATFEFYYNKTKYIALATTIGALLNIGLNYICIKLFGYIAAGYTTLVCYIAFAIFHYIFMNKVCDEYLEGVRPYNKKIMITLSVLFLMLGFVFLFTYQNIILRYVLILMILIIFVLNYKKIIKIFKYMVNLKKS
ncbi:MAG: oligosaccharide flippase family protein [Massilimicrobiota sp.]|nr:oligosaccharide flippase family protein [Massilimicrobiota sp.]